MAELVFFRPAGALNADAQLAAFNHYARSELSVFGTDLDWDALTWELHGVARISGRPTTIRVTWGHPLKRSPKTITDYQPMDPRTIDFFKSYLRYQYGLNPLMNPHPMLSASRHLDKALSQTGNSITEAKSEHFNLASASCRSTYRIETAYRIGQRLTAIARFLNEQRLVATPLTWACPIRRPHHFDRIGADRKRKRHVKLPSDRAIAALGEAYRRAQHPMDVIAASSYALLLSTHSRVSELHRLDAYDCEVETIEQGNTRYGWRWYPSKGGQPETRWIPTALVPLATEALQRLREATEPARELARKYIAGESILPQNDLNDRLARDGYINRQLLGTVTDPTYVLIKLRKHGLLTDRKRCGRNMLYRRAPIEAYFRKNLPISFPLADAKSQMRYDRALMVRTSSISRRSRHLFWSISPIQSDEIADTMNGKNNRQGRTPGLFERLSLVDEDGNPVHITPHQLRHYMTTLANEGDLSQLDIARWAGRSDAHHNQYYDHETATSLVSKARRIGGSMFGKELTVTPRQAITAQQVLQGASGAVHVTQFGACLHDFAMTPCPMFRDCLNCTEHACVKGDKRAEAALRDRLAVIRIGCPCTARKSSDTRRRLSPSTREARFAAPHPGRMRNRALLAMRCRRRNCCSGSHPIHRSRAWSLNAPACQPMSASQCSPSTATWRTLRPTSPRNGR